MDETNDSKQKKGSDGKAEAAVVGERAGQKLFEDSLQKAEDGTLSLRAASTDRTILTGLSIESGKSKNTGLDLPAQEHAEYNGFGRGSDIKREQASPQAEHSRSLPNTTGVESTRQMVKDAFVNSPMAIYSPSLMQEKIERITSNVVAEKMRGNSGSSPAEKQAEPAKIDLGSVKDAVYNGSAPSSSRPSWDNGGSVFDQLKGGNIKGVGACGPEESRAAAANNSFKVEPGKPYDSGYEKSQVQVENSFKSEMPKILAEQGSARFTERPMEAGSRLIDPGMTKELMREGRPLTDFKGGSDTSKYPDPFPQQARSDAGFRDPRDNARLIPDGHDSARTQDTRDTSGRAPEATRFPDFREATRPAPEFTRQALPGYSNEQNRETLRSASPSESPRMPNLEIINARTQEPAPPRAVSATEQESEKKLKAAIETPQYLFAGVQNSERSSAPQQVRVPDLPFANLARASSSFDPEQIRQASALPNTGTASERGIIASRTETGPGTIAGSVPDRGSSILPAERPNALNFSAGERSLFPTGMQASLMQDRQAAQVDASGRQIVRVDEAGNTIITGRRDQSLLSAAQDGTRLHFENGPLTKIGSNLDPAVQKGQFDLTAQRQSEQIGGTRILGAERGLDAGLIPVNGKGLILPGELAGQINATEIAGIRQAAPGGIETATQLDDSTLEILKNAKLMSSEKRYLTGVEVTMAAILAISGAAKLRQDGANEAAASGSNEESTTDEKQDGSKQKSLHRRTHLISTGETLQSIAEEIYQNADIAWLIADLNLNNIKEEWIDGRRVVEFKTRQMIELPNHDEIKTFLEQLKKDFDVEKLVTVVSESTIDLELLNNFLGTVSGAGTEEMQPAVAAAAVETATSASKVPTNPLPELIIDMGYPEDLPVAAGLANLVKDISHRVGRLVKRTERKLGTA